MSEPEPPADAAPSVPAVPVQTQPPSPDVELAAHVTALPGVHRGGFSQPPTAPLAYSPASAAVVTPADDSPAEKTGAGSAFGDGSTFERGEAFAAGLALAQQATPSRGAMAGWALASSIAGLLFSFFVGWGFPLGVVGVVMAGMALRRPVESRPVAGWALALAIVSLVYSAGWLTWAVLRMTAPS